MGIGVLWVPALAGYIFLTRFNGTKFTLIRSSGYQFVLRAAIAGLILYVVATGLAWAAATKASNVVNLWGEVFPLEYSGTAALSFVIGFVSPWFLNLIPYFDKFSAQRRAAFLDGDQIGLLVDRSIEEGQIIELALSSGKSYVGRAVHGTFGHRDIGDVLVVPVLSGYRDREKQSLVLTTNYEPVLRDSVELDRFHIAIPIREIVSVRIFDLEIYGRFH